MKHSISNTIKWIVFIICISTTTFANNIESNKQPRYAPGVVSIIHDHNYISTHKALIYWKISPYYLPQPTDASCSLASATMIINAIRIPQIKYANQKLATPNAVVQSINSDDWANAVKQGGIGVSLDQFGVFLTQALKAYHIPTFKLEVIHAGEKNFAAKFHQTLVEGEKTGRIFIIVNFEQKFISGTENVGHFSPVGAYDAATKRVLIMDPDGELFEPYWIPEERLVKGMTTKDSETNKNRGFVTVKLE